MSAPMKIGLDGLAIVKAFESCLAPVKTKPGVFAAYYDPVHVLRRLYLLISLEPISTPDGNQGKSLTQHPQCPAHLPARLGQMQEPASIRYKNPGAMWGSALAIKWGAAKKAVTLNDGKGQGNNIAVFPTFVQGICAQLDLWRTSKNYRNKRFADAIAIWSGHNEVPSYIAFCKKRVPGLTDGTIMDYTFWQSPSGIAFLKAQAWHEAGKPYPAPDADWIEAQRRVFSGVPTANTVKKAATSVVTGTVSGAAAGAQAGFNPGMAILIGLGVALAIFLAWKFWPRKPEHDTPHPALTAPLEQPQ